MKKQLRLITLFAFVCTLFVSSMAFAAPVKNAVILTYFSQNGDVQNVENSWYATVVKTVADRLNAYGIRAVPVDMPWQEFANAHKGQKLDPKVAQQEWGKYISSHYDSAVNVFVDTYKVNPDKSVSVAARIIVSDTKDTQKLYSNLAGKMENVKGKPQMQALQETLASLLQATKKNLDAVK